MSTFPNKDALRASLAAVGMGALAERVVATVRPVVVFQRRQEDDASLPAEHSKIGGLPDLPEGFAWPQRPGFADAQARVARLRKAIAEAEDPRALSAGTMSAEMVEQWERMIRGDGAGAERLDDEVRAQLRDMLESFRQPSAEDDARRASRVAWMHACIDAVQAAFPLVFVAQLDLVALSVEPGFDPLLPHSGVLSIFADMTEDSGFGGGHRVFWHDVPAGALAPRQPPDRLRVWHDTWDEYGLPQREDSRWDMLTKAERLLAHSGVSVPQHWSGDFERRGLEWDVISRWFGGEAPHALALRQDAGDTAPGGSFGDRLGGWPVDIQGHVENDLAGGDAERVDEPGRTPWRQLFSYGGEYYAGTRRMAQGLGGDGQHYLMLREQDLAARRFDRVRDAYQCT